MTGTQTLLKFMKVKWEIVVNLAGVYMGIFIIIIVITLLNRITFQEKNIDIPVAVSWEEGWTERVPWWKQEIKGTWTRSQQWGEDRQEVVIRTSLSRLVMVEWREGGKGFRRHLNFYLGWRYSCAGDDVGLHWRMSDSEVLGNDLIFREM